MVWYLPDPTQPLEVLCFHMKIYTNSLYPSISSLCLAYDSIGLVKATISPSISDTSRGNYLLVIISL